MDLIANVAVDSSLSGELLSQLLSTTLTMEDAWVESQKIHGRQPEINLPVRNCSKLEPPLLTPILPSVNVGLCVHQKIAAFYDIRKFHPRLTLLNRYGE